MSTEKGWTPEDFAKRLVYNGYARREVARMYVKRFHKERYTKEDYDHAFEWCTLKEYSMNLTDPTRGEALY